MLILMLDLWPQAETPGVTYFGAYHRPPDGHFFQKHCIVGSWQIAILILPILIWKLKILSSEFGLDKKVLSFVKAFTGKCLFWLLENYWLDPSKKESKNALVVKIGLVFILWSSEALIWRTLRVLSWRSPNPGPDSPCLVILCSTFPIRENRISRGHL